MKPSSMRCSRFCTTQVRPTYIQLTSPPWRIKTEILASGKPYTTPHYCSRLEKPKPHDQIRIERPAARRSPKDEGCNLSHHTLAIQTAPRPDHDSLQDTLDSLEHAGLQRWQGPRLMISDGYMPEEPFMCSTTWQVFPVATSLLPLGSAKSFVALLRRALEIDPKLEFLTYLQDDIVLSRNSLDYISQIAIPRELSLVSWFNTDWHKPDFTPPAILGCRPTRFFIRSQGMTVARFAIDSMLYCHMVTNWPKLDGCDAMPAWALADIPYADHYPSLVQHTEGFNSACNRTLQQHKQTSRCPHKGARISPSFMGEEFDALSLLPA